MAESGEKKNSRKPRAGKKAAPATGKKRGRVEISAGGIVFRRTPKGVRVALLLDPFGKWAFAKGHVEPGETIRQAAVRETMEEMGLAGLKIHAKLGKIDFWFRDQYRPATRGMLVHKYVHFFLMEAPADQRGRPQKKERIKRIIWIGPRRLRTKSSYEDVQPIVDRAVRLLKKMTGGPRRRPLTKKN
jgi:8-oxo-dGTP pyrophosphatase MutT (NUDIX family)